MKVVVFPGNVFPSYDRISSRSKQTNNNNNNRFYVLWRSLTRARWLILALVVAMLDEIYGGIAGFTLHKQFGKEFKMFRPEMSSQHWIKQRRGLRPVPFSSHFYLISISLQS